MRLRSLELDRIKIEDAFWSKHVDLVRKVIIPYQWEAMNDRIADAESSHCLENFKIAAKRAEGEFYGAVFQDTDIAKWLEAVGFTLASCRDDKLEETADEVIDLICEAQCEDGYLNTYFTIKEPDRRWSDLCEGHELYTAGHMMEAAVAYYQGTGKNKFLKCVCRFADLICNTFGEGEGKVHGYPGHQEVEIGLIKLYQVTGEERYLKMAKYFIDARGEGENYFLKEMKRSGYKRIFPEFVDYDTKYSQSHLPVREQETAEGHAVRAVYMYCAMADLADEYQDEELMHSCEKLWNNIVQKRMYITGSIGSSGILERFTTDYDLPNEYNYSESCASIGLALFGMRMGDIKREAAYFDVVERALYNTVLAGIALDGRSFFYVNPLEVWPKACMPRTSKEHIKPVRQKWFGVACCPPNIARTLASLGQYIYGWDKEHHELFVNLFISNETRLDVDGTEAVVNMETAFPVKNEVQISMVKAAGKEITLAVRIPDYALNYRIYVGDKEVSYTLENGYAKIGLKEKMSVVIRFEAPPRFVWSNPQVRADAGKTAVIRGPVVYCLEEIDNGRNLSALFVDTSKPLVEMKSDKLGGIIEIELKGKRIQQEDWGEALYESRKPALTDVTLHAVPYAYWNNRGEGEMCVWLKEWMGE